MRFPILFAVGTALLSTTVSADPVPDDVLRVLQRQTTPIAPTAKVQPPIVDSLVASLAEQESLPKAETAPPASPTTATPSDEAFRQFERTLQKWRNMALAADAMDLSAMKERLNWLARHLAAPVGATSRQTPPPMPAASSGSSPTAARAR